MDLSRVTIIPVYVGKYLDKHLNFLAHCFETFFRK